MDWRGNATAVAPKLAQGGHPVIQCPTGYLYFDYLPATTPVQKVYSYNTNMIHAMAIPAEDQNIS